MGKKSGKSTQRKAARKLISPPISTPVPVIGRVQKPFPIVLFPRVQKPTPIELFPDEIPLWTSQFPLPLTSSPSTSSPDDLPPTPPLDLLLTTEGFGMYEMPWLSCQLRDYLTWYDVAKPTTERQTLLYLAGKGGHVVMHEFDETPSDQPPSWILSQTAHFHFSRLLTIMLSDSYSSGIVQAPTPYISYLTILAYLQIKPYSDIDRSQATYDLSALD
jgi:hypothetical protein